MESPELADEFGEMGAGNSKAMVSYENRDPDFTGGIVGPPGKETIVFPSLRNSPSPPEFLPIQTVRRLGSLHNGGRWKGVSVAFAWNLLGIFLASRHPEAAFYSASGLTIIGLGFTLWSALGLLGLSFLSRAAVYQADRFALDHGESPDLLKRFIQSSHEYCSHTADSFGPFSRITAPVPSAGQRLSRLEEKAKTFPGAWHSYQTAFFLSMVCFGFLSRALPENFGHPELWILNSGD